MTPGPTDPHKHLSDAGLNLLWPGLAQLCQRRYGPAGFFSVEAGAASVIFFAIPLARPLAVGALVVITVWSVLDAWWAGRGAGPSMSVDRHSHARP
jgi:hypothetical protein